MKKRLITLLLALSMILALTACGGKKDNGKDKDKTGGQGSSEQEIPEKPDYTIKISAAVTATGDAFNTLKKASEDFNASQEDYELDLYYGGDYASLLTVIQSSSPNDIPDLFMLSENASGTILAQERFFEPVQKFIDEDKYDISKIVKFFGTNNKRDGKWVAIPWGCSNSGQFWNKDVLAKVGLTIDDLDSYEDILAACDKLAAAGYKKFYAAQQLVHNDWFNWAMAAEGINYMDKNNGYDAIPTKFLYEDDKECHEAALAYFTFLRKMIDRGYVVDKRINANDMMTGFAKGDYLAVDIYNSRTTNILKQVNGKFQVGYNPAPTIHANVKSKGQAPGGNCFIIGKSGNYWSERGAWEFIKFLLDNVQYGIQYAKDTGYTPATYSVIESQEYKDYVSEVFPDTQRLLDAQLATPEGVGVAHNPVQYDIVNEYIAIVDKMYNDPSYTPEAALKDYNKKCNEAIELYRVTQGLDK